MLETIAVQFACLARYSSNVSPQLWLFSWTETGVVLRFFSPRSEVGRHSNGYDSVLVFSDINIGNPQLCVHIYQVDPSPII